MTLSISDILMAPLQVQVVPTAVQFGLFAILGDSEK